MGKNRIAKTIADMGRKELQASLRSRQKYTPELQRHDVSVMVDNKQRIDASKMPFGVNDRVQVIKGPHKNTVGRIVARYPLSNSFMVSGVTTGKYLSPIEMRSVIGSESYQPVSDEFKIFDYRDLRLVAKIRGQNNEVTEVAVDHVSLGAEKYDPVSNSYHRERYVTHDPSKVIPWPLEKAEKIAEEKNSMTTSPELGDLRTQFVTSAVEMPVPLAAVQQFTNVHNRFKRARYAKRVTERDLNRFSEPEMPSNPQTTELLKKLKEMRKPQQPLSTEAMEFIGKEVQTGLAKRLEREKEERQRFI